MTLHLVVQLQGKKRQNMLRSTFVRRFLNWGEFKHHPAGHGSCGTEKSAIFQPKRQKLPSDDPSYGWPQGVFAGVGMCLSSGVFVYTYSWVVEEYRGRDVGTWRDTRKEQQEGNHSSRHQGEENSMEGYNLSPRIGSVGFESEQLLKAYGALAQRDAEIGKLRAKVQELEGLLKA